MESWEDEGGLTTLRLLQQEPWVRGGVEEVKRKEDGGRGRGQNTGT